MTIAVRPSLGRPGLGLDERIRDGGAAVVWQPDPDVPHHRIYAESGVRASRFRRASSCAAPGLLGMLEVDDSSQAFIVDPAEQPQTVGPGVWGVWAA